MKFTKKKVILFGAVIIIAGVAVSMKMKGNQTQPVGMPVVTTSVAKKDIEQSVSLKAPLEGTESVDISSRLHYEVLEIYVKEGDKVEKDQLLAILDKEKIQEEINKARDDLQLAKMQLEESVRSANESYSLEKVSLEDKLEDRQKEYEQAVKDYEEAKRQYDNVKALYDVGAESLENVKLAQVNVDNKQRIVDGYTVEEGKVVPTQAELKALETSQKGFTLSGENLVANSSDLKAIEIKQKELDSKLKDLEECEIKSSIGGTVTRVHSKVGRFADDSSSSDPKPMFVIENIDKLQMTVNVSEYDIDKIKVGQNVVISADILGKDTVNGVVARISPTGEEKNSNGNIERVIPTQIDVIDKGSKLIAGISATAKIEIAKAENTFVVPLETLLDTGDGTYSVCKVTSENKIEIVPVELGIENDLEVEVKSDKLAEGDAIIMTPDYSMTDGMDVLPAGGMA